MSILKESVLANDLFGSRTVLVRQATATGYSDDPPETTILGTAMAASSDGRVDVVIDGDDAVTHLETSVNVQAGDTVTILVVGTRAKVTGVKGGGDREKGWIDGAVTAAVEAANTASEALAEAATAQDRAGIAEAAALAASQAAAAAQTQADWVKNQQEYDQIAIGLAQQAANDAKTDALLAKAGAEELQGNLSELRSDIQVSISEAGNSIMLAVESEYAALSDLESLEASMSSKLELFDDNITLTFSQQAELIDATGEALAEDKAERNSYYRFTATGMEIGRVESPFKTLIDNTHMGFLQDGNEVAAIYNNRMYVTVVEAKNTLTVGASNLGQYDLYQKANGNLSLKFRGGV